MIEYFEWAEDVNSDPRRKAIKDLTESKLHEIEPKYYAILEKYGLEKVMPPKIGEFVAEDIIDKSYCTIKRCKTTELIDLLLMLNDMDDEGIKVSMGKRHVKVTDKDTITAIRILLNVLVNESFFPSSRNRGEIASASTSIQIPTDVLFGGKPTDDEKWKVTDVMPLNENDVDGVWLPNDFRPLQMYSKKDLSTFRKLALVKDKGYQFMIGRSSGAPYLALCFHGFYYGLMYSCDSFKHLTKTDKYNCVGEVMELLGLMEDTYWNAYGDNKNMRMKLIESWVKSINGKIIPNEFMEFM